LDDFRGCYRYNLLDENVRRFSAEVPQIWQWDDHEVTNNWSSSKDLAADNRYREKNIRLLVDRARQAYLEYAPLRIDRRQPNQIRRRIAYGPLLDVFVVDMRSYRGPNTFNRQPAQSPETDFLGKAQMDWLQQGLRASRATWKVIAADMPVGLLVADGKDKEGRPQFEAISNGDGPALGRELEIAGLLSYLKRHGIRNTVWLTADVHYTAAHYYNPAKAQFTDFLPFWEFVSGPLNAGTFGPGVLDDTFGPSVMFQKAPPKGQSNLSPLSGMQFFGDVRIDGKTKELSVSLRDLTGSELYAKTLTPEQAG
jgi:alkaline phosphatase D